MTLRFVLAALCGATAVCAHAATSLSAIRYTPDITVTLGAITAGPADVVQDVIGTPALTLSALPANLAAYRFTGTGHWLVFETTVVLPGGITATPRDVIGYDGTTYTLLLDGAAAGIPAGVAVDALATTNGSDFLLSFDTTAVVGALTAAPADVVRYSSAWSGHFDSAAAGVPAGANLDAVHRLSNGHLLVSFDTAGTVGSVNFTAGDVLEFTAPATWEAAFSPATYYAGWGAANLRGLWAQEGAPPPGTPPVMGAVPDQDGNVGTALAAINLSGYVTLTEGEPIISYAYTGALPPGLNFNTSTGVIDGSPTGAGVFTITVTATDNDGASNGDAIQFVIAAGPPGNSPPVMGNVPDQTGTVGTAIAAINLAGYVALTEGDPIMSYAYTGTLPPGINFNTVTGLIDGTPTTAGTYSITVTASDDDGASNGDAIQFTISAAPPPPPPPPPGGSITGVPTLSEWGLLLTGLLLGLLSVFTLHRKESD